MEDNNQILIDNWSSVIRAGHSGDDSPPLYLWDLNEPIKNGCIEDWDKMEQVWQNCFTSLNNHSTLCRVLLTETPLNPIKNREKMLQLMFEKFDVAESLVNLTSACSLISTGRTTGLECESGHGVTSIVSVLKG